jgi:hypothetical protein
MRTLLRFAGAAAVAVVCMALFVVPGLAGASSGTPRDTGPGRIEPAPAVDLPAQVEPAGPVATPVPATTAPELRSDPDRSVSSPVIPDYAPVPKPAEPRSDPNGSVSSPVLPFDPGYWTPERMANAKPMPMPTVR